jgi:hypothetical protein
MAECLSYKCEVLSSNPSANKKAVMKKAEATTNIVIFLYSVLEIQLEQKEQSENYSCWTL